MELDALQLEGRAANADAEAALRSDKELQNQRDMAGVANVARVRPSSTPPRGALAEPGSQSVVSRVVASSLAKLFFLAAVLGGASHDASAPSLH